MFRQLRSLVRSLTHRGRFEDAMAEEMRFHLDAYAADLERSGLSRAEAVRRARLEFGGVDTIRQDCRQAVGLRLFDELRTDVAYATRVLRQTPGFAMAAILSLGIGIGANTAIFSLIDAVLLRPLDVTNPHELVFLAHGEGDRPSTSSNYPLYERYRTAPVFSGITLYRAGVVKVAFGESIELLPAQYVGGNFHAVVGAPLILGRGFVVERDRDPGGNPIVVISEQLWNRRFGRSPDVLGRTLIVHGRVVSVVGVAAGAFGGFTPGSPVDLTLPLSMHVLDEPGFLEMHDSFISLPIVGRLKPDVSVHQAEAVLNPLFTAYMAEPENAWAVKDYPRAYSIARVQPAGKGSSGLRRQYSRPLVVLMGMVALVLLIASANVANLLLARSAARAREVAIRMCVGGGRARLIRQFLTESVVLAAAGAAVGVLLAEWGAEAIVGLFSTFEQPLTLEVAPNTRVLAFTAGISVVTAVAFGLAPALKATRLDLTPALKEGGLAHGATPRRAAFGRVLVSGQIAMCLVVVAVAALLGQSVYNLKSSDAGFDSTNVVLFSIDTYGVPFERARLERHYRDIVERLGELPGVQSVALSTATPIHTNGQHRGLHLPSLPDTPEARGVWVTIATEDYLKTMGVKLLRGRSFTPRDVHGRPAVAMISETTARYVFGDSDPLGRTIAFRAQDVSRLVPMEIVGVVQDVRRENLRDAVPRMVYRPLLQEPDLPGYVMAAMKATSREIDRPAPFAAAVRGVVRGVTPDLVVNHFRTLDEQVDASLVRERALTWLSSAFGALALLLSCVGLYGVVAYNLARRTREFGIRMALGARRAIVVRDVLVESVSMSLLGILAGIGGALGAAQVITTFLYGLSARDPVTLMLVGVVLLATTTMAALLPARRAMRIDPATAIRAE